MRIKSISVNVSRKFTRNFSSVQNSVGLTADLEEGEDHRTAVEHLQRECLDLLLREKAQEKPVQEGQGSKPVGSEV